MQELEGGLRMLAATARHRVGRALGRLRGPVRSLVAPGFRCDDEDALRERGGAAEVSARGWQISSESDSDWRSHAAAVARSVDLIKARLQVLSFPPLSLSLLKIDVHFSMRFKALFQPCRSLEHLGESLLHHRRWLLLFCEFFHSRLFVVVPGSSPQIQHDVDRSRLVSSGI